MYSTFFRLYIFSTLSILSHTIFVSDKDQQPIQKVEVNSPSDQTHKDSLYQYATQDETNPIPRIAIIGAGPAGSSTAYHLRRFSDRPLNITIFDSNSYIGGRTTTVNAFDDPRYPVELGASIFVEINEILYNATRDFELALSGDTFTSRRVDTKYDLGVWDGTKFVFYAGSSSEDDNESKGRWMGKVADWWDIAKLIWRYGLSPLRLRNLQQSVIGKFLRMYHEDSDGGVFPFPDLSTVAADIDLLTVTGKSGSKLLSESGISEKFAREIVQASSRVNYAQNLYDFHGLETMVCMSTEGAMSIEGGNWQIFDHMVKFSGAEVRLNTTVTNIDVKDDGTSHLTFKPSHHDDRIVDRDGIILPNTKSETQPFDTIVLAHPHDPSILTLNPQPDEPFEHPDYVSLHVTLFTTPSRPHPDFFNLNANIDTTLIPSTILTTLPPTLDPSHLGRGRKALGLTPFWSLSTLGVLNPSTDSFDRIPSYVRSGNIPETSLSINETQYLYKIFSAEPITAEFLVDLFQWKDVNLTELALSYTPSTPISSTDASNDNEYAISPSKSHLSLLPDNLLTWSHTKVWRSYPYLPPRTEFEPFDVYTTAAGEVDGKRGKVWRTSPMEVFISTMETMALSGMNVARLIVDGFEGQVCSRKIGDSGREGRGK